MPAKRSTTASAKDSTATIGFEAKPWLASEMLRNNMAAADQTGARKTATGSPQGEHVCVYQFYTPVCVMNCPVEMLAPYNGCIYVSARGAGGIFFGLEHWGRKLWSKMRFLMAQAH